MKLTKNKLKQLIREALREVHEDEEGLSGDEFDQQHPEIAALMSDAQELYASLPDEGKRALTQNFEMYFNKWEEELEGEPDGESEDLVDVGAPSLSHNRT